MNKNKLPEKHIYIFNGEPYSGKSCLSRLINDPDTIILDDYNIDALIEKNRPELNLTLIELSFDTEVESILRSKNFKKFEDNSRRWYLPHNIIIITNTLDMFNISKFIEMLHKSETYGIYKISYTVFFKDFPNSNKILKMRSLEEVF